jgi:hypothetical protein
MGIIDEDEKDEQYSFKERGNNMNEVNIDYFN